MAHFAQLDNNDEVIQVIVMNNSDILNEEGIESEDMGIQLCKSLYGDNTAWIQTSYNSNFRGNYAGEGFHYDRINDGFYVPQPYSSWTLDLETFQWNAPTPPPDMDGNWQWEEDTKSWIPLESDIE